MFQIKDKNVIYENYGFRGTHRTHCNDTTAKSTCKSIMFLFACGQSAIFVLFSFQRVHVNPLGFCIQTCKSWGGYSPSSSLELVIFFDKFRFDPCNTYNNVHKSLTASNLSRNLWQYIVYTYIGQKMRITLLILH